MKVFAQEFELYFKQSTDTMAINITWVGHTFYCDRDNFQHELSKQIGVERPLDGKDGSMYLQWYAMTKYGDPINLLEYADHIASGQSTHVITFHDF